MNSPSRSWCIWHRCIGEAHKLPDEDLLALDEALTALAAEKPDHAKLVELRFVMGMTGDEAATVLGISPATGDCMWRYARAWLHVKMQV